MRFNFYAYKLNIKISFKHIHYLGGDKDMEYTMDRANYRRASLYKNEQKEPNKLIYKLIKTFIYQMMVGVSIVIVICLMKIMNFTTAVNFIQRELEKDVSLSLLFEMGQNKFSELINLEKENSVGKDVITNDTINDISNDSENILCISTTIPNEPEPEPEPVYETAVEGVNQLKQDSEYIKENYKFDYPLKGEITSRFGVRESTNPIVTPYHSGIDIAADTGTKIKAALSGKVIKASYEGAYGKHVVIQHDDLTITYAHCSSLKVKEGQNVKQGDIIGLVGSTGLSTGPHLHFEIRLDGRIVNPDDILKF
jgi:murein DD-endopeptidase MepM/ murein hydrolase activator NlpD